MRDRARRTADVATRRLVHTRAYAIVVADAEMSHNLGPRVGAAVKPFLHTGDMIETPWRVTTRTAVISTVRGTDLRADDKGAIRASRCGRRLADARLQSAVHRVSPSWVDTLLAGSWR